MPTPLMDRIKAAEQRNVRPLRPAEPVPFRPRWLERLTAKDMTEGVLYNGAVTPRGSGGAA